MQRAPFDVFLQVISQRAKARIGELCMEVEIKGSLFVQ